MVGGRWSRSGRYDRACRALQGELADVLGRGSQQRLDPDGVEATAAGSPEPASLLPVAEHRLDPGLSLPNEATGGSGAEIGDRPISQAAVIRP